MIVSFSSLQAGQLALSIFPMRFRYWFTGACPILSCEIQLVVSRLILVLLIVVTNFTDGVDSSIRRVLLPLVDPLHASLHFFLALSTWDLFTADGFMWSGFRKYEGKSCLSELVPSAAFLASLSASSFPSIPSCPAVHLRFMVYFVFDLHF